MMLRRLVVSEPLLLHGAARPRSAGMERRCLGGWRGPPARGATRYSCSSGMRLPASRPSPRAIRAARVS